MPLRRYPGMPTQGELSGLVDRNPVWIGDQLADMCSILAPRKVKLKKPLLVRWGQGSSSCSIDEIAEDAAEISAHAPIQMPGFFDPAFLGALEPSSKHRHALFEMLVAMRVFAAQRGRPGSSVVPANPIERGRRLPASIQDYFIDIRGAAGRMRLVGKVRVVVDFNDATITAFKGREVEASI